MPPPPPPQTVFLRRSAPDAASDEAAAVAIVEVEGGDGVDLAQVGRALGLDPATVRLNGYFLSRGSGHVSLSVTWGALLAFFAARGLPTGADPATPVAVHGRLAPSHLLTEPGAIRSSKRKSSLETENCSKKSKLQHHIEALSKCSEEILSDDITLGLKRRLRLDEATPSKKIKQVDYNSVNGEGREQPVKFSCSFINGHSKRLSDKEMVTSLLLKRVRTAM
ncbi:uncharacterized protein LOC124660244 [Lolium rigidum]|uniref:uncharacterized protein LOC124660229 n=1 Tax=Lolium rigidum TaxID=89674 RepID=UPI001F5CD9ED|nr:uncharacterized protein LOC124660229 [Lolium rigidum]XP_047053995.1 uncharacterized protein LOC124660244 [Lolium rigidum]